MTKEILLQIFPECNSINAAKYLPFLAPAMLDGGIISRANQCAFLAQLGHESGQFRNAREIWGPTEQQKGYEGRKDLGNIYAGDGIKFKGRGLIQITGRNNYFDCSKALMGNAEFINHPELLELPEWAVKSAVWFWNNRNLSFYGNVATVQDKDGVYINFRKITKKINGGYTGYNERLQFFERALQVIPN